MQDLQKACSGFIMAGELHLTYLVTPVHEDVLSLVHPTSPASQWRKFLEVFWAVDRNPVQRRVAAFCGITEAFYSRCTAMQPAQYTWARQFRALTRPAHDPNDPGAAMHLLLKCPSWLTC